MTQSNWRPPNIERYTCKPTRSYQDFSPKQKISIWLLAILSTWLMGLGVVKLILMMFVFIERVT